MDRDKLRDLAMQSGLHQAYNNSYFLDYCVKFAALIEREVRGDAEPVVNNWWVFNNGAEVARGLSLREVMGYLTDERLDRGWGAVCVVDKENMPTSKPHAMRSST